MPRTEADFLKDCSDQSRPAWQEFFAVMRQARKEIRSRSDRISLWLKFDEKAGVSLRLRHPAITHSNHQAPLLWGFPTRSGYPDVLQTRLDRMLEVGIPKAQCDWYLGRLNDYARMDWPSSQVQNVRADIRTVMSVREFPTIVDVVVTFIDRLNDLLPPDKRIPSLLEEPTTA